MSRSNKPLVTVNDQLETATVRDLKKAIAGKKAKYGDINRQELRLEPKGKALRYRQGLGQEGQVWGHQQAGAETRTQGEGTQVQTSGVRARTPSMGTSTGRS